MPCSCPSATCPQSASLTLYLPSPVLVVALSWNCMSTGAGPLGAPEPLSAAAAKDAGDIPDVLGMHLARCLYSKSWQLREASLQQLLDILRAPVRNC